MFRLKKILADGDLLFACIAALLVLAFLAFAPDEIYNRLVSRGRFLVGLAGGFPAIVLAFRGLTRWAGVKQQGQAITAAISATTAPGATYSDPNASVHPIIDAVLEGGTTPLAIRTATNDPVPALADADHLPSDTPLDGDEIHDYTGGA